MPFPLHLVLCVFTWHFVLLRLLWRAHGVWRVHLTGKPQSDAQVRSGQGPVPKHSLPPGPGAAQALACAQSSSTNILGEPQDGCDG